MGAGEEGQKGMPRWRRRAGRGAGAALCALVVGSPAASAQSVEFTVDAKANIYAAGQAATTEGLLPIMVPLPAGDAREVTFSYVAGATDCDHPVDLFVGPDGTCFEGTATNLNASGGISGIYDSSANMFMVGVFIGDAPPAAAPLRLDFSPVDRGGLGHDFSELEPALGQQFFVGDGLTSLRSQQRFVAPDGATALYLGFADGFDFTGNPGAYGDNSGSLNGTATVHVFDRTAPAPPVITSPADGSWDQDGWVVFTGTAEPASKVELFEGAVLHGTTTAARDGSWTIGVTRLAEGNHLFSARATDGSNNRSLFSNPVTVRVDSQAPETSITAGPEGITSSGSPSFSFSSPDGTATFQCRLDGPAGTGSYAPCTSPKAYSGLLDGAYTFLVRAVDPAGNIDASPASRSFTVSTASTVGGSQTTTPQGDAAGGQSQPPSDEPPPPEVGKSVNVAPEKGQILIRVPGTDRFRPLRAGEQIPTGSIVDARKGTVRLVSAADGQGAQQAASFWAGVFRVTQTRGTPAKGKRSAQPPVTVLTLRGSLGSCPKSTTRRRAARKAGAAAKRRKGSRGRKGKGRRLWGRGKGNFRTNGRYSSAAVRGTTWLTEDRCDGTLTRVKEGRVAVRDRVRRKTVTLKAGQQYVARPRRR